MASFTAEVKDELSRVEGRCPTCERAQLSALLRVCGTLSFKGTGRYALRITTETGAVARTIIKLVHDIFDLNTSLTIRRSVLHKTRNYLIELAEQDGLEEALVELGILVPGQGLAAGIPRALLQKRCCREAFVRGAFMAGGFIADPRGDFHLELAVTGEDFANELAVLVGSLGVHARLNRRRGAYAIYLKSFDDIVTLLVAMGAARYAHTIEGVRAIKSVKNDVNRRVNAELANQNRAGDAADVQRSLIDDAEQLIGLSALPRAVREFCELRRANPELSLAELGQELTPPASKSAMYHRLLRLQSLVDEARAASGAEK
ncbi:MAG: DNA-binding protein WhiA [Coriobacteriaceae bacterium]|nr:DNA-binding protein WhiA [Coriobacteriaceae bacterium]